MNKIRKISIYSAVAAVAVIILIFSGYFSNKENRDSAPLFELTSQHGETTSLEDFRGDVVLLTFLYTQCPIACPLLISSVQNSLSRLDTNISEQIRLVAVSVDPDRDTPEALQEYGSRLPYDWLLLTGTSGQLRTTWENYGITAQKQAPARVDMATHGDHQYQVTHTLKVVLIDKDGMVQREFTGDWTPDEMADSITQTLQGQSVVQKASLWDGLVSFLYDCGPISISTLGGAFSHLVFMVTIPLMLFGLYRFLR